MMRAYRETHVRKAMHKLACMFDFAVNDFGLDGEDFAGMFMSSEIARRLEAGDPTMHEADLTKFTDAMDRRRESKCRGRSLLFGFGPLLVHVAVHVGALKAGLEAVILAVQFVISDGYVHAARQLCLSGPLLYLIMDSLAEDVRNIVIL